LVAGREGALGNPPKKEITLRGVGDAKGDWGNLAQHCEKARIRASKDIHRIWMRMKRDGAHLEAMKSSIRRRSSWACPHSAPRVSSSESRGPLGLHFGDVTKQLLEAASRSPHPRPGASAGRAPPTAGGVSS
jgi:hypothetical protein